MLANGRKPTHGGFMTWKSQQRLRSLLSSAALIGLMVTTGYDTAAIDVTKLCPNHAYVAGVYTCLNFAYDFQQNCQAAGQQSWTVTLSLSNGDPQCAGHGHAFNVVTAPSCDLTSGLQRYCAVEPQTGQNWCWTQNAGSPSIPSWVMEQVAANMGGAYPYCVAKGLYVYLLNS
jgi:hypothetical protein